MSSQDSQILNGENSAPKSGKDSPKAWVASKQRTFGFKGPPRIRPGYLSNPIVVCQFRTLHSAPSISNVSIENRSPNGGSDEIVCQLGWMGLQS